MHVGDEIRKVLNERGMSITGFAKRIHRSREAANGILNRPSINTEMLHTISGILDHDFFKLYSDSFKTEARERMQKNCDLIHFPCDSL